MSEAWKPIKGYADYEVSSRGRVRSVRRRQVVASGRGRQYERTLESYILTPNNGSRGYFLVTIRRKNKPKTVTIHSLVCSAFHGPRPSDDHVVRHLNGDASDNNATNLAWGTVTENVRDIGRHGRRNPFLTPNSIRAIRRIAAAGRYSHVQIAKHFNVTPSCIGRVVNRKTYAYIGDE